MGRRNQIQLALDKIDSEIAVLQLARQFIVESQKDRPKRERKLKAVEKPPAAAGQ